ncbi:MAG TPA: kelch repeat-containing protein [Candidatus Eisenbacteria bacterium]|nr:kelch repeat-containing protein [Candidatus Eisenbacteria bacterium]
MSKTRLPGATSLLFLTFLSLQPLIMPEIALAGEIVSPNPYPDLEPWKAIILDQRLHGTTGQLDRRENPNLVEVPVPTGIGVEGSSDAAWAEIPPPALWLHSTIYDVNQDRLIVFGGENSKGRSNDVWLLNLAGSPLWSKAVASGVKPTARSMQCAVYDPVSDRMLVFGGYDGAYKNDVSALYLSPNPVWGEAVVKGTPPAPRAWANAIYDPVRRRLVLIGGRDASTTFSDVWTLSLGNDSLTWTQITPAGPSPGPRAASAMVYDSDRDRVVFFAGMDGTGTPRNDVWSLTLSGTPSWSPILPQGTPPTARNGMSGIYDPVRQQLVIFGGGTGIPNNNDTWTLNLSGTPTWTQLAPTNPPAGRQFQTSVYDPIGDRFLVFGGSNGTILSGTWALPLSGATTWVPLSGTRRRGHLAIYDPLRQRMVVVGGDDGSPLNDVWELDLPESPTWLKLTPGGTPPSARAYHAGIYDPVRDRIVLFGGRDTVPRNDTWELSFSGSVTWRQLSPTGTAPGPRIDHATIYDPLRRRLILFGGTDANGNPMNDVWALSLSGSPAWTQLSPTGTAPPARGAAAAVYDATRDRIVIFGGYDKLLNALSDAWSLTLSGTPAWSPLTAGGTPPAPRLSPSSIYDSQRERIVLFGGTDLQSYYADVNELTLFGTPQWSALTPTNGTPQARADHKAIYDPVADRMVVFGGSGISGGMLNDTWSLQFLSAVGADGPRPLAARVLPVAPNPSRAEMKLSFESSSTVPARIAVFAPNGRLVRELWNGPAEAGPHAVVWDGSDSHGAAVAAGVYFYVASIGAQRFSGKLVRIQ